MEWCWCYFRYAIKNTRVTEWSRFAVGYICLIVSRISEVANIFRDDYHRPRLYGWNDNLHCYMDETEVYIVITRNTLAHGRIDWQPRANAIFDRRYHIVEVSSDKQKFMMTKMNMVYEDEDGDIHLRLNNVCFRGFCSFLK